MELRGNMKGSTTLVASVGTKDPAAPEFGAGMKGPAAERRVVTNFTAVRPSVDFQNRAPPARILAPLEATTMGARRAATRIVASPAYTVEALVEAVFTEVAVTVD